MPLYSGVTLLIERLVKGQNAKAPGLGFFDQDAGNQKPGNHKKDVHPHKPTFEPDRKGMEQHHSQHGDSPQAINVWPILQGAVPGGKSCLSRHRQFA